MHSVALLCEKFMVFSFCYRCYSLVKRPQNEIFSNNFKVKLVWFASEMNSKTLYEPRKYKLACEKPQKFSIWAWSQCNLTNGKIIPFIGQIHVICTRSDRSDELTLL